MKNELTQVDIDKIQQELDDRAKLRKKLIADVQTAREFGDLSENFEYKAAKWEKNRNESRIRYLNRVLQTADVVLADSKDDEVGLFDKVTVYYVDEDEEEVLQLVTTMRQNAMEGLISKASPVGAAIFGKKVGDRVTVHVSATVSYDVIIRAIEKGEDDASLDIRAY
ncbi:MAG: GreA/GreB family elongation factor [Clostridia bacterium]|nr:GreA/GreB family elongation factor [Clostridia bacterium]